MFSTTRSSQRFARAACAGGACRLQRPAEWRKHVLPPPAGRGQSFCITALLSALTVHARSSLWCLCMAMTARRVAHIKRRQPYTNLLVVPCRIYIHPGISSAMNFSGSCTFTVLFLWRKENYFLLPLYYTVRKMDPNLR